MIRKIVGCGLPIFCSGAIAFAYPGVMSSYWQNQFSVGSEETGLVITFMLMALALTMFFSGRVHLKIGMPNCIILGTVIYEISFIVAILAKNIYWIYIGAFISNVGSSFLYGPGLTTGQQTYPEKKGLISGILNMTFGFSAAIMSPVLNHLLNNQGYNFVNVMLIVVFAVVGAVAYLLVKSAEGKSEVSAASIGSENDLSVVQAVKTKNFWLIWLVWVFMGAAGISMVSLAKSYGIALGLTGVAVLTAFNFSNGISRIFVGICVDKIGGKITGVTAFSLAFIGYIMMPHVNSLALILLGAIFVGIGFGTMFTISGPVAIDLFGMKNFGMIYGVIFTAYGLVGGVIGPAVAGKVLALTNDNYTIVFTYLGIMALIGAVLMSLIKKPKEKK